jgi:hypothetical protein
VILDHRHANQLLPTRNELLADQFLKAAGIATVYVDAAGEISAFDVGFEASRDGVLLCCAAGKQVAIVAKAASF